jgi:hypothetical protein
MRISATVPNVLAASSPTPGAASSRSHPSAKTATPSPPQEEITPSGSTSNTHKTTAKRDENTSETLEKSVPSKTKTESQPSEAATKAETETEKSAPEEGRQRLSERLKQRDLDVRLYELTNAVKGVRHAGHVRFEASADAPGGSLAVDRESTHEQDEASQAPSIAETIQRKNDERALKAKENAKRTNEAKARDAEAKRDELERDRPANQPIDAPQAEIIEETQTARERLEQMLLSAKPLPSYANALGYVDAKRPYGDSGLLDVFV